MDINRRDYVVGGVSLIVGSSVGFASGMAFEASLSSSVSTDETESAVDSGTNTSGNAGDDVVSIDVGSENRATLGDSDAPLKMFYWGDYQCPFCYRFESQSLPSIQNEFVETGDVEVVFKPLSVFGEDSFSSALGSHCVLSQSSSVEEWFEWHTELYKRFQENSERNDGWASASKQAEYASEFSFIDGDELASCVDDRMYSSRLQSDRSEATQYGFEGTPFFLLYHSETGETETVTGAQPFSRFSDVISSMLA